MVPGEVDAGALEVLASRRLLPLMAAVLHVPALHASRIHAAHVATAGGAAVVPSPAVLAMPTLQPLLTGAATVATVVWFEGNM
jgi:hypothetical protein